MRARLSLAFAFVLVAAARSASADPPRPSSSAAAAQALFYDARALMKAGRYAEACPKLEESLRLDRGIGTTFNLADCQEHLGKIATAWSGFLDAAAASKAAGQAQRERVARERAARLEPRLPKLVVEVGPAPPGLLVERDGVPVGPAAFGTPIPVDPGAHHVVARASGYTPKDVTIEAREGRVARVVVRDLAPEAPAAVATAPAPPPPTAPETPPRTVPPPTTTSTTTTTAATPTYAESFPEPVVPKAPVMRTAGWVTISVGGAAVAASAFFGLRSLSRRDEARDHCNGDLCDARGVDLRARAIRAGDAATGLAIGGGAAIATGILLVVLAPRDHARTGGLPGRWQASADLVPGGGTLLLGGSLP